MGLFGNEEKKQKELEEQQEKELLKRQIADLKNQISSLSKEIEILKSEKAQIHHALNVLDGDLGEHEDKFKEFKAVDKRLMSIETQLSDLIILGKLAIENRDELTVIMNILKKMAEPDFRDVVISHDSEVDRFKHIENELDKIKEREIVVEHRY